MSRLAGAALALLLLAAAPLHRAAAQTTRLYSNGGLVEPGNPLPVTPGLPASGVAPVPSAALEASHVLKAAGGILLGFQVNFAACASYPCWVMVFNAASLPADGAVTPVEWYEVSANSTVAVNFPVPLSLSTGITVGCSTSGPFTLAHTAQCAISGQVQ